MSTAIAFEKKPEEAGADRCTGENQQCAYGDVLHVGAHVRQRHAVLQHADHEQGEHAAGDATLTAEDVSAAEDDRGDGVELKVGGHVGARRLQA